LDAGATYPVWKIIQTSPYSNTQAIAEEQAFEQIRRIAYRTKTAQISASIPPSLRPFSRVDIYDPKAMVTRSYALDETSISIGTQTSEFACSAMLLGYEPIDPSQPILDPVSTEPDPTYCLLVSVDPTGFLVTFRDFEGHFREYTVPVPYQNSPPQTPGGDPILGANVNPDGSFSFRAYLPEGSPTPSISPATSLGLNTNCRNIFQARPTFTSVLSDIVAECPTQWSWGITGDVLGYTVLAGLVTDSDEFLIIV
jgi:hypothetical protein